MTKEEAIDIADKISAECSSHDGCDNGCPFYTDYGYGENCAIGYC